MEERPTGQPADAEHRLVQLVDAYTRRVTPAVLEQHGADSVCSALGVWLLLAACLIGAEGAERVELERAVGCPAAEAADLLDRFMAATPPALKAAIAVWVNAADATDELATWVEKLPAAVESGYMPTQQQANAWADRHTLGLIKSFPIDVEGLRVALASALATRVSWESPFELVTASEHLGASSPWRGTVERVLWDPSAAVTASLAETSAAGVVAVHEAVAREDLTVISVSADPGVDRTAVLEATHEIATHIADGSALRRLSLFTLPLGDGHSWTIAERETRTSRPGERVDRIAGVSLPAWRVEGELDLKRSAAFAALPVLEVLRMLIGPRTGDDTEAKQVALASFTRYGFEAAAVTAFGVRVSAIAAPSATGIERAAVLRFDHPYAALAVSGRPTGRTDFAGLPLFSAWIATPAEARDEVESP